MRKFTKNLTSFFVFVLVITGAICLTACGDKEAPESPETKEYIITYIVDGQEYSTFETLGNEIIPLPTIELGEWGILNGWFLDEEFSIRFDNSVYENDEINQDINVYASIDYIFKRDGNSITGLTNYGKNLLNITIPRDATNIGELAFKDAICSSINFNNCTNLKTIGFAAFKEAQNLTTIDLSNCTALNYISDNAFTGSYFNNIILPSSITGLGSNVFSGTPNLATIDLTTCTKLKNLGNYTFSHSSLNSVKLPSSLTSISNLAFHRTNLAEIVIDNSKYTSKDQNGNNNCLVNKDTNTLIKATGNTVIPEYVENLDVNAFSNNDGIKNVILPSKIRIVKEEAFYNCSLESITFSSNLQQIERKAFEACKNLNNVDFSACINLTSIENLAFIGCEKLTSADLSNCINLSDLSRESFDVSTNIIIDNQAYTSKDKNGNNNCLIYKPMKRLEKANALTVVPDYIEDISEAFEGCEELTTIDLSNCTNLREISYNAFADCINLESINLSGCTKLYAIGERAFKNCVKLTTIDFGDCIELNLISEGSRDDWDAFEGCDNLKTVIIANEKISNNITSKNAYSDLFANAETIYIKTGLAVFHSNYLRNNFTKHLVSDKDGFDKYVINAE